MPVDLLRDELLRVQRAKEEPADDPVFEATGIPGPSAENPHGPCKICGERDATHVCVQCERPVCVQDLWAMFGLCRACLTKEEMQKARQPKERARPDLGIKWVEE